MIQFVLVWPAKVPCMDFASLVGQLATLQLWKHTIVVVINYVD